MARTQLSLPISGAKLRVLREKRGWDQGDVTKYTEEAGYRVARSRVSRIETEAVKPTPKQIKVLLEVFEVALTDVLDETPAKTTRTPAKRQTTGKTTALKATA